MGVIFAILVTILFYYSIHLWDKYYQIKRGTWKKRGLMNVSKEYLKLCEEKAKADLEAIKNGGIPL